MWRKIDRTGYVHAAFAASVASGIYLTTIVALLAPVAGALYP